MEVYRSPGGGHAVPTTTLSLLSTPPEGRVLGTGRYFKVLVEEKSPGAFSTRIVMQPETPMITATTEDTGSQDCLEHGDDDDSGCYSADRRNSPLAPSNRLNIENDVLITPRRRLEICAAAAGDADGPRPRWQRRILDADVVPMPALYPCSICGRPFAESEVADLHTHTHKDKEELVKSNVFHKECRQCNTIFFSHRVYQIHKARHHPNSHE